MKYLDSKGVEHDFSSFQEFLEWRNKCTPFYVKFYRHCRNTARDFTHKMKNLINPHNVVTIKTLSREWWDFDTKLLHASFQLFSDFVEKEKGLDSLKYQYSYLETNNEFDLEKVKTEHCLEFPNPDEEQKERTKSYNNYLHNKKIYEIALDQYNWWKNYPKLEKDIVTWKDEENLRKEENRRLNLLIKYRHYYWT